MGIFYMNLGKLLVYAGLILLFAGILIQVGPKLPILSKLGKLPGDIRIEKENFQFYFPLATCLLLSAIFTLIALLFRGKS